MKGVNWSKIRKVLKAVIVCLGITTTATKSYYRAFMHYSDCDNC
jgi:hypothetical protein